MNPAVIAIVKYLLPPLAWLISLFIPGRNSRVTLREAKNKAEIMSMVSETEAKFPSWAALPLSEQVEKCYQLGSFPALWAVEGLGNYYAETVRNKGEAWHQLLTGPQSRNLPSKSLTMLHAGIGLSFAKRTFEGLSAKTPGPELRKALEKFIELARNSGRTGYVGATLESLGLVSIILHDVEMAKALDRLLAEIDPNVASFMWRGAGRALYFHPKNFIPGGKCPWRGIEMCSQIAPHEMARRNLRAGISWAITLVNMRHPEVMEEVLSYQGEDSPDRDFFVNGVTSSMIMRYDISPDDVYIERFINHEPDASRPVLARLWKRDIKQPCEEALRDIYPVLKQSNALEEVFHYQSLPQLAQRLRSSALPGRGAAS